MSRIQGLPDGVNKQRNVFQQMQKCCNILSVCKAQLFMKCIKKQRIYRGDPKKDQRYFYLRSNRFDLRNITISVKGNHKVVLKKQFLIRLFGEKQQ